MRRLVGNPHFRTLGAINTPEKMHLRPLLIQNGSLILNDLEKQWKSAIFDERATVMQQAL